MIYYYHCFLRTLVFFTPVNNPNHFLLTNPYHVCACVCMCGACVCMCGGGGGGDGDVVRRILYTYIPFTLAKVHFTCLFECVICAYSSETEENTISLVKQVISVKMYFYNSRTLWTKLKSLLKKTLLVTMVY